MALSERSARLAMLQLPRRAATEKGSARCAALPARLWNSATILRSRFFAARASRRRSTGSISTRAAISDSPPWRARRLAEIPFVDTHFHLHDMKRPELRYSWLERDAVHGFLGNIDA